METEAMNPYTITGLPGSDFVPGDFVVGPGRVDFTIRPGESRVVQMTVSNRTGERRRFNLTVEDARGSTDPRTGIELLGDDRGPYSMRDYISVPAWSFELDHNSRAQIPVTVSVPPDAEPGGLYGSVLVNTVAVESNTGEEEGTVPQSAIVARIGTLFFLTIPGATERSGQLLNFGTVPPQTFFSSGPISFGILFENTGSIHLAPYAEVTVKNFLGEEVGRTSIEPWFVLPQSQRLREFVWDRELLIGRYTATLALNRSYDDVIDEATYAFWVLPWRILLAAFGVLFVVIFLIRLFLRTFEFRRRQ
jgi:hypothetical protein